tara:strand:- start:245 stop:493 length:249 start_codon:yes stop_codon:yes gene_type:complete
LSSLLLGACSLTLVACSRSLLTSASDLLKSLGWKFFYSLFAPGFFVEVIPAALFQELDSPVQGIPEMFRAIFSWAVFISMTC